jgi:hypothetical protein
MGRELGTGVVRHAGRDSCATLMYNPVCILKRHRHSRHESGFQMIRMSRTSFAHFWARQWLSPLSSLLALLLEPHLCLVRRSAARLRAQSRMWTCAAVIILLVLPPASSPRNSRRNEQSKRHPGAGRCESRRGTEVGDGVKDLREDGTKETGVSSVLESGASSGGAVGACGESDEVESARGVAIAR